MKKMLVSLCITTVLAGLLLSGCRSEEPKEPPKKEAIQAAADKAHEIIDKTAATSQTLAEKAEEIKATARQAAADMSATILKDSEQDPEQADKPAPADTRK